MSSTVWNCHYFKIKYWWVLTLRIAGLSAMIISSIIIFTSISTYFIASHMWQHHNFLHEWLYMPVSSVLAHSLKQVVLVSQLCPTLCYPMDCSSPGSCVYGFLQARILEWVAFPFSNGSSWPRDRSWVSCIAGRFFTIWAGTQFHFFGFFANNHQNNLPKTQALPYHLWPYFWLL